MSRWKCNLCEKKFGSKRALYYHQKQAVMPCDGKCVKCGHASSSMKDYKNHQSTYHAAAAAAVPVVVKPTTLKTHPKSSDLEIENLKLKLQMMEQRERDREREMEQRERDKERAEEMEKLQFQVRELLKERSNTHPSPVPANAAENVVDCFDEIRVPMQDFEKHSQTTSKSENDEIRLEFERVTVTTERLVIVRKRKARARHTATPNLMRLALEALDWRANPNNVGENMMYHLVANKDVRLQNIFISDDERLGIWSRNPITDVCGWILHEANLSAKILQEYAQTMFAFLLEAGVNALVPAFFQGRVCLALHGIFIEGKNSDGHYVHSEPIYSFIIYEEAGELRLRVPETSKIDTSSPMSPSLVHTLNLMVKVAEGRTYSNLPKLVINNVLPLLDFLHKKRPEHAIRE